MGLHAAVTPRRDVSRKIFKKRVAIFYSNINPLGADKEFEALVTGTVADTGATGITGGELETTGMTGSGTGGGAVSRFMFVFGKPASSPSVADGMGGTDSLSLEALFSGGRSTPRLLSEVAGGTG